MGTPDDAEAAYFALLRAKEELVALRRYEDYLAGERRRIRRFRTEGAALEDEVPRSLRRVVAHTDESLDEALETRMAVVEDELRRLPDRLEAAEEFVETCEQEHRRLAEGA